MRSGISLLASAVLLAVASSATAQYRGGTWELEGFAGYLLGGNFGHSSDFGFNNAHIDVQDDVYYGGRLGYNFTPLWEVEVEYAQSKPHLEAVPFHDNSNVPGVRIGDIKFEYYMAYMTLNFGHGRWVGYFTLGSGAANLVPTIIVNSLSSSSVRYTSAIGGGAKWFIDPHFALRFDGRLYSTFVDKAHVVCGPNFCTNTNWVSNWVFDGGVVFAF